MWKRAVWVLALVAGFWGEGLAHGGGLDLLGCHHDRKRGGYHCHRGPLAGQYFASKDDARKTLDEAQQQQSPPSKKQIKPPDSTQSQSQTDQEERTVYVTRTGTKYHGLYCSYLRQSRIPISLKEAREQGYTACSRCRGR